MSEQANPQAPDTGSGWADIITSAGVAVILSLGLMHYFYADKIQALEAKMDSRPPVAVIDYFSLAADLPENATEEEISRRTAELTMRARELREQGFVVLRSEAALAYPQEYLVKLENNAER